MQAVRGFTPFLCKSFVSAYVSVSCQLSALSPILSRMTCPAGPTHPNCCNPNWVKLAAKLREREHKMVHVCKIIHTVSGSHHKRRRREKQSFAGKGTFHSFCELEGRLPPDGTVGDPGYRVKYASWMRYVFYMVEIGKSTRYIEVIKKVLPSCMLFSARLGATSETGQNNNKSSRVPWILLCVWEVIGMQKIEIIDCFKSPALSTSPYL
jgi:hypothetical protein